MIDSKKKKKEPSLKLSVSSVDTFQTCRAKWYYRYVEKLPTPSNYHLTTGKFIHKILEIFLKRYKKSKDLRDAGNVAYYLAKKDEEIAPDLTKEIKKEGLAWLKEIVRKYEKTPELIPNVLKIESPFTFKIDEDNILVRGFIDRIDQIDENTVKVVDYKTNSNPDYLKPLQLLIYSYAIRKRYPGKKITAAYELVRHEFDSKEIKVTEEEVEAAIQVFKKVGSEIKTLQKESPSTPWEASITKLCGYCPYRMRCEQDRAESSWKV